LPDNRLRTAVDVRALNTKSHSSLSYQKWSKQIAAKNTAMVGSLPLAVRLPNWIGDVVMSVPTLDALHRAGFELQCFGRTWAKDLLAACPWRTSSLPGGIRADARCLRASRCVHGLLFPNSFSTALAMRLARIQPAGYTGNARWPLLRVRVARGRRRHEVEAFWRLGSAVQVRWRPRADWPTSLPRRIQIPVTDRDRQQAAAALRRARASDHGYWVLAPGATGTIKGRTKVWPHWQQLGQRLHNEGCEIVVCPGPGEVKRVRDTLPAATLLDGVGLGTYLAILSQAELTIANDSGPMHLAAASGCAVLGIFGHDATRTYPWNGHWIGDKSGWPSVEEVIPRARRICNQASH